VTTSLAEDGFLSDETAGVVDAVEQRYAAWLALFRSVNGRAVKAQYEAHIPRAYLPALVAAACYMRTLTTIQGAVLLIMRGMDAPARILLRAAMESLFKLKAIEQDRNVVNAILAGDDFHRKGLLKKYKRIDDPQLQAELDRIGELKSPAADSFTEWGVTPLTVEQMAEKADMTKLYLSAYPVLSDTAHAGIRDLERHVETDHAGEVTALHNEPNIDNLETLFLMATEFLISALEGFAEIVKLDLNDFCEVSKEALKQLADAHRPPKGN
jgi:hypothetical protein